MGHVFVSYSHKDTKYAHRLADDLQTKGFEVWIDERLDYGSQWPLEIQKQLDTCDAFILVMTPRSFASDWVQSELQRAKRKLKPILPLLLEGDEPWLSVESTQYFDVRDGRFPDLKFYSSLKRVVTFSQTGSTLKFKKNPAKINSNGTSPRRKDVAVGSTSLVIVVLLLVLIGFTGIIGWKLLNVNGTPASSSMPITQETLETLQPFLTSGITLTQPYTPTINSPIVPSEIQNTLSIIEPVSQTETPRPTSTFTATSIPTLTPTATFTPTLAPIADVPLYNWYSRSREDNFASTFWIGSPATQSPDYEYFGVAGYVFGPNKPQPEGTVALYKWYSSMRDDNLVTTVWIGGQATKSPDYHYSGIEGYIYDPALPQPQGTIKLYQWYSPMRGDNFITSVWTNITIINSPDYHYVQLEGYILPP